MDTTEKFSLKDHLFNKEKVTFLAKGIKKVYPAFDEKRFITDTLKPFAVLELKQRIYHMREMLKKYLPSDFEKAVKIILASLPKENDTEKTDDDFGDFIYEPYNNFIATYGCTKEHLSFSLHAIHETTRRFSAEDAIRYFINAFPKETLEKIKLWATDSHYHVRRLVSEGTRPKLPWSQKVSIPYTQTLPLLEKLYTDKTRYVTRSVANHLNDISKTDPDVVINTLEKWEKSKKQKDTEIEFIIKHALRNQIKNGNKKALALIGINHSHTAVLSNIVIPKKVFLNTYLEFAFMLETKKDEDILVDYCIWFQNKQGQMKSKKVFKLKKIHVTQNSPIMISKKHLFRENMTTRTLYRGKHQLDILVNGTALHSCLFELV